MVWKKRPPCIICGKPSLIFMFDNVFCGDCVVKHAKIQNERVIKEMKEVLGNGS